jgi:hypothetical protein
MNTSYKILLILSFDTFYYAILQQVQDERLRILFITLKKKEFLFSARPECAMKPLA